MKFLIIISLIILASCKPKAPSTTLAPPVSNPAPTTTSFATDQKTISIYLTKFEEEYTRYTSNTIDLNRSITVSVSSSLNGSGNIGSCTGTSILLQETYWNSNNTTNSQREQLIFHEINHCALSIVSHNNGTIQTTDDIRLVPSSIMNENSISDSFYRKNRTYYLEEMFGASITNNPATNNSDDFPEGSY